MRENSSLKGNEVEIIKAIYGSNLYGTNIKESDMDYKFVFLPEGRDIILQRAAKHIQRNTKSSTTKNKNTENDIDCEGFSLQQWFKMLTEGQTFALEMLFIPEKFQIGKTFLPIWSEIQNNKERLISKKIAPFVGYCRAQASKYSIKAERIQAAKKCIDALSSIERIHDTLEVHLPLLTELSAQSEFIEIQYGQSNHSDNWFSCCGRKTPLGASSQRALKLCSDIYEHYGQRARLVADGGNVDWKALYHSLRIANEAHELLTTKNITLPRPESSLLLKIRKGEMAYQDVSMLIEEKLHQIDNALIVSDLRDTADHKWIDDFIFKWYMARVI